MEKKDKEQDVKKPKGMSATKKPLDGIDVKPQLKATSESEAEDLTASLQERKALTIAQRAKRARELRAREPRLQRAKEIAAKRLAPESKLKTRAEVAARELVKRRFSPRKNVPYAELTTSEKIQVDTAVAKKVNLVKKIAQRLLPKIRRSEVERLKSFHKGEKLKDLSTQNASSQAIMPKIQEQLFNGLENYSDEQLVEVIETMIIEFKSHDNPVGDTLQQLLFNVLPKDTVTESLLTKSEKTGVPFSILREVFERGLNSYESCRMTPEQFAFTRVNSYIAKGKAYHLDEDLRAPKKMSDLDESFISTFKPRVASIATEEDEDLDVNFESYEVVQNRPYVKVNTETGTLETVHPKRGARKVKTNDFKKPVMTQQENVELDESNRSDKYADVPAGNPKHDATIKSAFRKIKAHPEFKNHISGSGSLINLSPSKVKKHTGIDLHDLHKNYNKGEWNGIYTHTASSPNYDMHVRHQYKEDVKLDEITYRDSGYQNMLKASLKADRIAAKDKARKEKIAAKNTPTQREIGKTSLRKIYTKDTPYQEENDVVEEIKGWKNAARDLAKWRSEKGKNVKLVSLKKDGAESKLADATTLHGSEEDAIERHDRITSLNPNKKIKHNLYVDGKLVRTLGEDVELDEARRMNLGRAKTKYPNRPQVYKKRPFKTHDYVELPNGHPGRVRSADKDNATVKNVRTGETETHPHTDLKIYRAPMPKESVEEHPNCGTPDCCGQCSTSDSLNEAFVMDRTAGVGVTVTAEMAGINIKPGFEYAPGVKEMYELTQVNEILKTNFLYGDSNVNADLIEKAKKIMKDIKCNCQEDWILDEVSKIERFVDTLSSVGGPETV